MRQNLAVAISMLLLALVLIGAQTHALFTSKTSDEAPALKTSIIETLRHLQQPRDDDDDPPSPFNRGVPDLTIE